MMNKEFFAQILKSFSGSIDKGFIISKIASALKPLQNLIKLDLVIKITVAKRSVPAPSSNETKELFMNLKFLQSLQYLDLQLPARNEIEDFAFEILAESLTP